MPKTIEIDRCKKPVINRKGHVVGYCERSKYHSLHCGVWFDGTWVTFDNSEEEE